MTPPTVRTPHTALIIGGGIGGLSTAIRLAARGWRVRVFEAGAQLGGKMNQVRDGGFRWDTGPSVITMRPAFEALFAEAGRRLEDELTLLPVDPLTRYFFADGSHFDAAQDPAMMRARVTALAGHADAEGYLRYLAYAARIHDVTAPVFIYNDPPTLGRIARTPLRDMPAVDPLRTMQGAIESFVDDPRMRQFLGRFATYVGASPYLAPATLNVIAHVELSGGVWYPQGGIYQIAAAFERVARALGVEIVLNTPVSRIVVEDGRARGVLAGGQRHVADAVIANVDVATVYERLLGPAASGRAGLRARLLRGTGVSGSGFILLLGVEGETPALAHHNIFFSRDYRREFTDLFTHGQPAHDPTVYVAITSKTDRDHAPPGCENWFVLVNAPPLDARFDWATGGDAYRDRVLAVLAEHGHDVRGRIRAEHRLTPHDLERMTGARRGALYGISSNNALNALRRPHNRAPDVRGLYFAGGTAHPGGGVPMVTLSGAAAAHLVLADFGGDGVR
jgi:phytoene desaturase